MRCAVGRGLRSRLDLARARLLRRGVGPPRRPGASGLPRQPAFSAAGAAPRERRHERASPSRPGTSGSARRRSQSNISRGTWPRLSQTSSTRSKHTWKRRAGRCSRWSTPSRTRRCGDTGCRCSWTTTSTARRWARRRTEMERFRTGGMGRSRARRTTCRSTTPMRSSSSSATSWRWRFWACGKPRATRAARPRHRWARWGSNLA
mmetsp:Transcript_17024/g.41075  ORF Transcript_17024/g.41075 Transcript_17024/m.41075 type:complete len:205 (+) Transcript_17024:184-798(+)